jgi:putative salt-induced outer membrane protein YdiY
MKNIIVVFTLLLHCLVSSGQSIVNTEKLFTTNDEGLGISSELAGSSISGNASVLLLEYGLNFSYKKDKHYLRLLSGGEYINEDNQEVSNSLFTQFRYNYFINPKSRFFGFSQIQSNAILLLERRILLGGGYRRNLIDIKKDSTKRYELDFSIGIMQEEELLNGVNLPNTEKYHTNYTRAIFSIVGIMDITDKVTIVNTTYFQQYVSDFNDYRLLNETNLMVKINEWLLITVDLEYRFDSEPPSILRDRDFNTNLGLVFNI